MAIHLVECEEGVHPAAVILVQAYRSIKRVYDSSVDVEGERLKVLYSPPEKSITIPTEIPEQRCATENHPVQGRGIPIFQILMLFSAVFGIAHTLCGSYHWWMEKYYHSEGVRTETGVVLEKWQRKSNSGESNTTRYHIRYGYIDQAGRLHKHEREIEKHQWDEMGIGSKLPTIEFLESAPRTHRYVSETGLGPIHVVAGLFFFWALVPLQLLHKEFTAS